MIHDIGYMADVVDALESEIAFLSSLDPFDPHLPILHEKLEAAIHEMYRSQPRGV